jgi:hypothetical protein
MYRLILDRRKITSVVLRSLIGLIILTICGLAGILLGFVIIPTIGYRAEFWMREFDADTWRNESDHLAHTERRKMIRDLTRNHLHTGMTREDVEALLGKPTWESPDRAKYWLGYPRWHPTFDHDVLEVFYDESGKMTDFRVRNT